MRIIARLDVKPPYVIKGVHYDGLRKIGTPEELALKYYNQGADEIFYIDIVSSLYRREILYDYIEKTAKNIFVPFCVGGGVKTLEEIGKLLHCGADKILLNTFAIENPQIIKDAVKIFGSQCIVVSVEAKKRNDNWECFTDCGRIPSGKDVLDWVREVEDFGAGELLVSSVDCDGRQRGFDIELIKKVSDLVTIPVVAGSGAGNLGHIKKLVESVDIDAIALASVLHYDKLSIEDVRECIEFGKVEVELCSK